MIHELVAVNYGCLKQVTAKLTPLHAFIGPNDSGKSTLLHGIRTVVQFADDAFHYEGNGIWRPFDPWLSIHFSNTHLVEEPENGLHPSRIADVVRILRAVVDKTDTQIIMATHSPLVINELKPDEVTVVTRPNAKVGTVLTPIADTPDFERRSQVYALGELWRPPAIATMAAPPTTALVPPPTPSAA